MRAIITGAASGIGRAVAETLAARGAALILTDRNGDGLNEVRSALGQSSRIETIAGDISDPDLPAVLVKRCVEVFGGIDAIASNAGTLTTAPLVELEVEAYDRLFAINTRPAWLLGKAAYPYLVESGGAIVATASTAAQHPTPPLGSYSASKAALVMLVRQMALEWGPVGIRVNTVSPGPTLTAINAASYADPARLRQREQSLPLRRLSEAQDIANAICFLLSAEARQITGHDLVVDSGMGTALSALVGAGTGLAD